MRWGMCCGGRTCSVSLARVCVRVRACLCMHACLFQAPVCIYMPTCHAFMQYSIPSFIDTTPPPCVAHSLSSPFAATATWMTF
jgi:hypothetical protein